MKEFNVIHISLFEVGMIRNAIFLEIKSELWCKKFQSRFFSLINSNLFCLGLAINNFYSAQNVIVELSSVAFFPTISVYVIPYVLYYKPVISIRLLVAIKNIIIKEKMTAVACNYLKYIYFLFCPFSHRESGKRDGCNEGALQTFEIVKVASSLKEVGHHCFKPLPFVHFHLWLQT